MRGHDVACRRVVEVDARAARPASAAAVGVAGGLGQRRRVQDRAAEQSPSAAGAISRSATFAAPADCPPIVTLLGVAAERRDVLAHPLEHGDVSSSPAFVGASQPGEPRQDT